MLKRKVHGGRKPHNAAVHLAGYPCHAASLCPPLTPIHREFILDHVQTVTSFSLSL
jgi:aspartate-semialdehyde dehydrogenase